MTGSPAQPDGRPAADPLAARCRAFGLPLWRFDGGGALAAEPTGWGPAQPWLGSAPLRDLIRESVRGWSQDPPPTFELFAGCWLMPIAEAHRPGGRRLTVAMALAPDVLGTEAFLEICRSGRLETETTRHGIGPLARYDGSDVNQLATALRGVHDDLVTAANHDRALDAFSEELALAYEQITLLYELGRSMNWLTKPREFVKTACNLLLGILDFKWIAVKYTTSNPPAPEGAGLVVAGTLPCPRSAFDAQVAKLLGETGDDQGRTLHEAPKSELAALVGSQVIADPVMAGRRVTGLLLAGNKASKDPEVTSIETQLLDATADYLGAFLHNVALYAEQREMFLGTIRALTAAIDAKDPYTRGHSERVAVMGYRLALAYGMSEEQADRVRIAGLVHDVGKIGVPESVLRKPGRLTDEEFEQIKRHPAIGHNILKDIAPLNDVLPGVLYHHERWDGRGYPEGLAGDQIPFLGRLLAVADAFDAMSSDRSYRPAIERPTVLAEMVGCAGTQFDPQLAQLFVTLDLSKYDEMVAGHRAREAEAA